MYVEVSWKKPMPLNESVHDRVFYIVIVATCYCCTVRLDGGKILISSKFWGMKEEKSLFLCNKFVRSRSFFAYFL